MFWLAAPALWALDGRGGIGKRCGGAWLRLLGMTLIMGGTTVLLPRLGMVWTSMLCFLLTAFLAKTRHPKLAVVCAVVIPLALYAFVADVAGLAIPQGHLVRLP
jgi:cell division protein FtsW (lipid II flippase)